ncbi:MAG TPA: hypothetical protein VIM85_12465 [Pseudomonadales bacterium]
MQSSARLFELDVPEYAGSLAELECIIRNRMTVDRVVYSRLEKDLNISDTYLRKFHKQGHEVCINILNRLANCFDIRYELSNREHFLPDKAFDAHNITELRDQLREKIQKTGARRVARLSSVSHTWVSKFARGEVEICFKRLHDISIALGVKYKLSNFTDDAFLIE